MNTIFFLNENKNLLSKMYNSIDKIKIPDTLKKNGSVYKFLNQLKYDDLPITRAKHLSTRMPINVAKDFLMIQAGVPMDVVQNEKMINKSQDEQQKQKEKEQRFYKKFFKSMRYKINQRTKRANFISDQAYQKYIKPNQNDIVNFSYMYN